LDQDKGCACPEKFEVWIYLVLQIPSRLREWREIVVLFNISNPIHLIKINILHQITHDEWAFSIHGYRKYLTPRNSTQILRILSYFLQFLQENAETAL
jgi:hypothetical protein